jgi:hypothetical protein
MRMAAVPARGPAPKMIIFVFSRPRLLFPQCLLNGWFGAAVASQFRKGQVCLMVVRGTFGVHGVEEKQEDMPEGNSAAGVRRSPKSGPKEDGGPGASSAEP